MEPVEVNVHKAKTTLSKLLQKVAAGEEVTISNRGVPVARLIAVPARTRPAFGADKGKLWLADDFDAPLPGELQQMFEGGTAPRAPKRRGPRKK